MIEGCYPSALSRRLVHLAKDPRSIERITLDEVQRSLGVPVQHVATYLALTEPRQYRRVGGNSGQQVVTPREARRLVELIGTLPDNYQQLSALKSPALRRKLADNEKHFYQRYRDNTISPLTASVQLPVSLTWKLDRKAVESIFREQGFHSLIRMLSVPETLTQRPEIKNKLINSLKSYKAVLNFRDYTEMLERIALSKVCGIDTEADNRIRGWKLCLESHSHSLGEMPSSFPSVSAIWAISRRA